MPENTLTGWKRRITAYCAANNIPRSSSQISRMALKINKRFEWATANVDATDYELAEAGLRILGIHMDPTARDAVKSLEAAA